MKLFSSHCLTVNVPYVQFLPEYRHQLAVSLPSGDNPQILACCLVAENLTQLTFREFPYHQLGINTSMILNDLTGTNHVDLGQVSVEARQLVHRSLSTG
jgi:hypothetical protein